MDLFKWTLFFAAILLFAASSSTDELESEDEDAPTDFSDVPVGEADSESSVPISFFRKCDWLMPESTGCKEDGPDSPVRKYVAHKYNPQTAKEAGDMWSFYEPYAEDCQYGCNHRTECSKGCPVGKKACSCNNVAVRDKFRSKQSGEFRIVFVVDHDYHNSSSRRRSVRRNLNAMKKGLEQLKSVTSFKTKIVTLTPSLKFGKKVIVTNLAFLTKREWNKKGNIVYCGQYYQKMIRQVQSKCGGAQYLPVFITEAADAEKTGRGIHGWSRFPWDPSPGIFIDRRLSSSEMKRVFLHQLGHIFGLYHTYHGEEVDMYQRVVLKTIPRKSNCRKTRSSLGSEFDYQTCDWHKCSECHEIADCKIEEVEGPYGAWKTKKTRCNQTKYKYNSESDPKWDYRVRGDMCEDTPPTPMHELKCGEPSRYNYRAPRDICGELFLNPASKNFMSKWSQSSWGKCHMSFTPIQKRRMRCHINQMKNLQAFRSEPNAQHSLATETVTTTTTTTTTTTEPRK